MSGADAPPRPEDTTAHYAALCKACNAAWVYYTLPEGVAAVAIEMVAAHMRRLTCPDCGAEGGFWALGADHARAVARLRAAARRD